MKNLSKKSISLMLIFTLLMAIFMPSIVNAGGIGQQDGGIIVEVKEVLEKESTVYFGEIFVDGVSKMQYVYSADMSRIESTFKNLKLASPEPFSLIVPTITGEQTTVGLNAYNYDIDPETNIDNVTNWTSASSVANTLYPSLGTIGTETNESMYDHSTYTKTEIDRQKEERIATYYTLVPSNKEIVSSLRTSTDFVWRNNAGVLVKEYTVTAVVEKTTVNYTSVNITTSSTPTTTTPINSLNINVASPKVGDTATATTKPTVTLDSNPNYEIDHIAYITAYPSEKPAGTYDAPFIGTFEVNKDYVVEVSLRAKDGFAFVDNNGMTLKVNGKTTGYEMSEWNSDNSPYYMFYTKVSATSESEETTLTTYEYIDDTANQTYTIGTDYPATFRINADYSLFENGGKVYVDDTLVSSDNYTSKSGSTIITFTKDYMSSLSEGEHTLKVAFNNGGEATTKFTIAKAEETTPTETTPTDNSKNPKTGDNIIMTISIFAIATLGAYTTLKVNRSRKMRKY